MLSAVWLDTRATLLFCCQVLPSLVPAPLETFSWEEMQEIEMPDARSALYSYSGLVTDAYSHCSPVTLR